MMQRSMGEVFRAWSRAVFTLRVDHLQQELGQVRITQVDELAAHMLRSHESHEVLRKCMAAFGWTWRMGRQSRNQKLQERVKSCKLLGDTMRARAMLHAAAALGAWRRQANRSRAAARSASGVVARLLRDARLRASRWLWALWASAARAGTRLSRALQLHQRRGQRSGRALVLAPVWSSWRRSATWTKFQRDCQAEWARRRSFVDHFVERRVGQDRMRSCVTVWRVWRSYGAICAARRRVSAWVCKVQQGADHQVARELVAATVAVWRAAVVTARQQASVQASRTRVQRVLRAARPDDHHTRLVFGAWASFRGGSRLVRRSVTQACLLATAHAVAEKRRHLGLLVLKSWGALRYSGEAKNLRVGQQASEETAMRLSHSMTRVRALHSDLTRLSRQQNLLRVLSGWRLSALRGTARMMLHGNTQHVGVVVTRMASWAENFTILLRSMSSWHRWVEIGRQERQEEVNDNIKRLLVEHERAQEEYRQFVQMLALDQVRNPELVGYATAPVSPKALGVSSLSAAAIDARGLEHGFRARLEESATLEESPGRKFREDLYSMRTPMVGLREVTPSSPSRW